MSNFDMGTVSKTFNAHQQVQGNMHSCNEKYFLKDM